MLPYLLMAVLYLTLAAVLALASALQGFDLLPFFSGLRWLRVHLITLGGLTQLAFGLLPGLAARQSGNPQPRMRWDIWLSLNLGLLILMVGIPLINAFLIITGGTLVFIASGLLAYNLAHQWRFPAQRNNQPVRDQPDVRPFYLAAVGYLLVGVLAGTGLWFGWGPALGMAAPIEMGTLDGSIITCPMHCAQFDATTGEVLAGPLPTYLGGETAPPRTATFLKNTDMLMQHIRTQSIHTYPTKVDAGWVLVAL